MKIVNIVNIPNYPNYTIYGKDIETLKIYVSDLLPNDSEEYNNEDLCINIDYTNIQDVTFGVYDNPKNDINMNPIREYKESIHINNKL